MSERAMTRSGAVEGERRSGATAFRSIPYASVRPGDGRLRLPGPAPTWRGTRSARERGPAAPQRRTAIRVLGSYSAVPRAGWHEDCLSLDVHTPACDGARRPVLLWIHGGAFSHGSGGWWIYSGDRLAARGDVVVVSINYRLGAFGNLDLRWLARGECVPNAGLHDQLAALRWVRDNVEAFGGDPENVTVFGQSAGAMSIGALLTAPAARGLFHRAILQSGAARNLHDEASARGVALALLEALGLDPAHPDVVERLRALPAEALLRAQLVVSAEHRLPLGMLAWQPVVDGDLLPAPAQERIEAGDGADVPVLIGTNREEWKMFTATDARRRNLDAPTLRGYLERTLVRDGIEGATDVDEILEVYGRNEATAEARAPADVWVAFQGDRVFRLPAVALADAHTRAGGSTFFYRFDRGPGIGARRVGACHAIELPFVFGTIRDSLLRATFAWPAGAVALSDAMQDAWLAFARHGDPSASARTPWPVYATDGGRAQVLGGSETHAEAMPERLRRFWGRVSRTRPPASTLAARA